MKKILIFTLLSFICLCSYGQLRGTFSYAQDGHIYFYLSNPTGFQIPVAWGVYNFSKNEQRQHQGFMTPGGTFVFGPNANWVWEKGERFAVTYANGQTVYWTCPETDPALKNRSNLSFRGAKKSYYAECVHCSCKLYVPTSGGDSYCANCANLGHKKSLPTSHVLRH